jgi:hypothetical protein
MTKKPKTEVLSTAFTPDSPDTPYEPQGDWRPLLEQILVEAKQRYGLPLEGAYEISITDGWFFQKGKQKKSAISEGEAFNLIGLMCELGDDEGILCGRIPHDKYDEIREFWQKASQDYNRSVVAGDIRVWARNGSIAGPFRPIATDTWEKAIAAVLGIDNSYGPINLSGWLATCIQKDELIGVPSPKLCSLFSKRIRERREVTSEQEMIDIIREAETAKGERLDVRSLKKICAEKCLNVSQEKFLSLEKNLNGKRELGRKAKSSK